MQLYWQLGLEFWAAPDLNEIACTTKDLGRSYMGRE